MKTITILLALMFSGHVFAQTLVENQVTLRSCDGKNVDAYHLLSEEGSVVVIFWSLQNKKSIEILREMDEILQTRSSVPQVKYLAVCVDAQGSSLKVNSFVKGSDIMMQVYTDYNNELKRAMSVHSVPYIIYCDEDSGYTCILDAYATTAQLVLSDIDSQILPEREYPSLYSSRVH